jgi:hypothetical protein
MEKCNTRQVDNENGKARKNKKTKKSKGCQQIGPVEIKNEKK